ncbi:hypothetical protein D3C74_352770 [compost metagenome]
MFGLTVDDQRPAAQCSGRFGLISVDRRHRGDANIVQHVFVFVAEQADRPRSTDLHCGLPLPERRRIRVTGQLLLRHDPFLVQRLVEIQQLLVAVVHDIRFGPVVRDRKMPGCVILQAPTRPSEVTGGLGRR